MNPSTSETLIPPSYIQTLKPYVPGKPIEETQREFKLKKVIKLASNENPLGPSPKAIQAARLSLKETHRYPDANGYGLKKAIAKHCLFEPKQIVLGNGSDDVVGMIIRAFSKPGDSLLTSQAAFVAYKIWGQAQGLRVLETPLTPEGVFDLEAMWSQIQKDESIRLVFIPNPNNPTGTYLRDAALHEFVRKVWSLRGMRTLVVLDYAYWEYVTASDLPDPLPWLDQFQNLIVLRTFSKIYGLAGFRVGYGLAAHEVIEFMNRVRQPFAVNSMALAAAEAALVDRAFVKKAHHTNRVERARWEKFLERSGIPYWKSQGNFILANVQKGMGISGEECFQRALRCGLILRSVSNYGLPDAIRISIGTRAENEFAFGVLDRVKK